MVVGTINNLMRGHERGPALVSAAAAATTCILWSRSLAARPNRRQMKRRGRGRIARAGDAAARRSARLGGGGLDRLFPVRPVTHKGGPFALREEAFRHIETLHGTHFQPGRSATFQA